MRKQLYWLSDTEWKRLEPLLPRGRRGAHRVDDRRVISGIVHMLRSGARWRDYAAVPVERHVIDLAHISVPSRHLIPGTPNFDYCRCSILFAMGTPRIKRTGLGVCLP